MQNRSVVEPIVTAVASFGCVVIGGVCVAALFAALPRAAPAPDSAADGNADMLRRQFARAVQDYTRMIAARPGDPQGYTMRGLAYLQMGDVARAIADETSAIARSGSGVEKGAAYGNRAICYRLSRNIPLAIKDFTTAIELNSSNVDAVRMRGECYLQSGQSDRAILDETRALRANALNPAVLVDRADAYSAAKEYRLAIADYTAAIQLRPDEGLYWGNKGWAQFLSGDMTGAISSSQKAITLSPNANYARFNLALCYAVQGKTELARDTYTESIALSNAAEMSAARQDVSDALTHNPNSAPLREGMKLLTDAIQTQKPPSPPAGARPALAPIK